MNLTPILQNILFLERRLIGVFPLPLAGEGQGEGALSTFVTLTSFLFHFKGEDVSNLHE
jgi:hypothetical protein